MERARVGLFEDHELARAMLMQWLDDNKHRIVLVGDSLKNSLELIDAAEPDSMDVALVDADLGKAPDEGLEVIKKLRQKMGGISIIGISFVDGEMEGTDVNIRKSQPEDIIEYIDRLE